MQSSVFLTTLTLNVLPFPNYDPQTLRTERKKGRTFPRCSTTSSDSAPAPKLSERAWIPPGWQPSWLVALSAWSLTVSPRVQNVQMGSIYGFHIGNRYYVLGYIRHIWALGPFGFRIRGPSRCRSFQCSWLGLPRAITAGPCHTRLFERQAGA